ncbi:hypothetical protein DFR42_11237 [Undibacterium pigrum]|uniref:Uncharacterized protein n=1 Tax=Undibacterium pigrum TaxID=401470 RepID=A0A318IT28_9BURK|nr:hypothetical protein DFR42_11237 [Undibacterium pigrum]
MHVIPMAIIFNRYLHRGEVKQTEQNCTHVDLLKTRRQQIAALYKTLKKQLKKYCFIYVIFAQLH